jgi:hypothetical protein
MRLASTASLAVAGLSLSFAAHAQSGQTIEGTFTNANSAPDWSLSGSRMGSIAMTPSVDGSGWLRLTPATAFALGRVQANAKIASGVPIHLEFDYLQWGGRFDGLSIYFADASVASAGRGGVEGGGLGYCGMTGAYLGIGFDDGGNFTATGCALKKGFSGGTPNWGMANVVGVRGPQASNYNYLGRFELKDSQAWCISNCTSRGQAINGLRHVVLDMTPRTPAGSGYKLSMTVNNREIFKDVDYPYAVPTELTMGLIAATGAYVANHEIRNVKLSVQGSVTAANCFNGVDPQTGRCRPTNNVLQNVDMPVYLASLATVLGPKELTDGDLAQAGWDGTATYSAKYPKLPKDECLMYSPELRQVAPVNQIVVVSRQDDWQHAVEPTPDTEFTKYGAGALEITYSVDGVNYDSPPGGMVSGNNKVLRVFDLPKSELITNLRVVVCEVPDMNTSPLTEILMREKK